MMKEQIIVDTDFYRIVRLDNNLFTIISNITDRRITDCFHLDIAEGIVKLLEEDLRRKAERYRTELLRKQKQKQKCNIV